jgi:cation diffusion facilitator family transporter
MAEQDTPQQALSTPRSANAAASLAQNPQFAEYPEDGSAEQTARAKAATRSTWVSVGVNLVLTALQVGVGVVTRSQALVADGLHSLSDLVADAVVLAASHQSRKDADADHPYGHQRYETAASLVLGLLLLGVAMGMLWQAVNSLQNPAALAPAHPVALWVALGTLVSKELLFRYMLAAATRVKSSMLVANAWHARSDAASSLVVALGIGASMLGYTLLDPIAALIVGLMVARMGWRFAWDALNDLLDRAADDAEVAAITQTLLSTPGVIRAHDIRTRKMGDMLLVDVHLEVDADITVEQGHNIAVAARAQVLKQHRVLNLMTHVDPCDRPDLDHPPQTTSQAPHAAAA